MASFFKGTKWAKVWESSFIRTSQKISKLVVFSRGKRGFWFCTSVLLVGVWRPARVLSYFLLVISFRLLILRLSFTFSLITSTYSCPTQSTWSLFGGPSFPLDPAKFIFLPGLIHLGLTLNGLISVDVNCLWVKIFKIWSLVRLTISNQFSIYKVLPHFVPHRRNYKHYKL